ncbi:RNA polymerase sigma factor [Candidatus Leptofilum sp.]|uniref:RNA polymerase sigma factor n=1 Tax=Candidatus Leptofilum sp. TaxID=3241576 RepID=UPI003B5CABB4
MPASEPSLPWQMQKHQEILTESNPTAFAQLAELALPHLIHFLRREFRQVEPHLCETAVIDCLLTYHQSPNKYNPDKLSLFAYLRMSARHDLLNAIDKHNRQKRPLVHINEPDVQSQLIGEDNTVEDGFSFADWLGDDNKTATQTILHEFEANLSSTDRQLFLLMLNGVRETEPYADILQISTIPITEQRREVKRAKDRLTKRLQRFVNRHKV